MMRSGKLQMHLLRTLAVVLTAFLLLSSARAALFEDDEARRAILDLRQRMEAMRTELDQTRQASQAAGQAATQAAVRESEGLGKGLLDLHRQLELLRTEVATLRGDNETLRKAIADLQLQIKNEAPQQQALAERLAKLEPSTVTVDGTEFVAEPAERREFEAALAVFRKGDFLAAQNQMVAFLGRYPASGYAPSALFWLGNAQYATRDYKEAITNFRSLVSRYPKHLRAPESVLSIANCQLELKDVKAARKTLTDLSKAYPQSEAAAAAKERLAALK